MLKQSPSGGEGGSVDVLMCKELLGTDDLSAILRDKEKVGLMWNCKYLSGNEKYENVRFLDICLVMVHNSVILVTLRYYYIFCSYFESVFFF